MRAFTALRGMLIIILSIMAQSQKVYGEDNVELRACGHWSAGKILEKDQEILIRAIGIVRTVHPLPGSDRQRAEGSIVFPLDRSTGPRGVARIALLDIGPRGPWRFVTRASRTASLLTPSSFGPAGPPQRRNIDSGFLFDRRRVELGVIQPIRCRKTDAKTLVAADSPPPSMPDKTAGETLTFDEIERRGAARIESEVDAKTTPDPKPAPPAGEAPSAAGERSSAERLGSLSERYRGTSISGITDPNAPSLRKLAAAQTAAIRGDLPTSGGSAAAIAETDVTTAESYRVCMPSGEILDFSATDDPSPIRLAGIRNNATIVPGYWYDSSIGIADRQPYNVDLSATRGRLLILEIPAAKPLALASSTTGDDPSGTGPNHIHPVRFPDLQWAPRVSPDVNGAQPESNSLNLIVVGDAPTVADAGLHAVEDALRAKDPNYSWRVHWYEIGHDGSLATPVAFADISGLIDHARALSNAGSTQARPTRDADFARLIDGIQHAIIDAHDRVDHVLWIKQGYSIPLSAPVHLKTMIDAIHTRGPIPRFPDGSPRKWLRIISAYTPGASTALLRETMARTEHYAGAVDEQPALAPGKSEPLLTKDAAASIALSIDTIAQAFTATLSADAFSGDGLHIAAKDAFADIGIVVVRTALADLATSIAATLAIIDSVDGSTAPASALAANPAPYDATRLWRPRSAADGRIQGLSLGGSTPDTRAARLTNSTESQRRLLQQRLTNIADHLRAFTVKPEKPELEECDLVWITTTSLDVSGDTDF